MIVITFEMVSGRCGYVQWRENYDGDGMFELVA